MTPLCFDEARAAGAAVFVHLMRIAGFWGPCLYKTLSFRPDPAFRAHELYKPRSGFVQIAGDLYNERLCAERKPARRLRRGGIAWRRTGFVG